MAVNSSGFPIEFDITGGKVHGSKAAPNLLIKRPDTDYVIPDKGYDSESIKDKIRDRHSLPVVPRKSQ
jgi:hypothetical protein